MYGKEGSRHSSEGKKKQRKGDLFIVFYVLGGLHLFEI